MNTKHLHICKVGIHLGKFSMHKNAAPGPGATKNNNFISYILY